MSDVPLKEHLEAILHEKDKALDRALHANEKHLDLLNELRGGVATKNELEALEKIVGGLSKLVYIGLGGFLVLQLLLQFVE